MNTKMLVLKGLPDYIVRRILPDEISDTDIAYANINTIVFVPMDNGTQFVAFDGRDEWNYKADVGVEELFRMMSGSGALIERA